MRTNDQIKWYLGRDGRQHGPISGAELAKLIELGHIKGSDLLWRDGFKDWMAPSAIPDVTAFRQRLAERAAALAVTSAPVVASHGVVPAITTNDEPPGRIFVSYRRSVDAWAARAVYEHLAREMGPARIFMDVDSIAPGDNFPAVLQRTLAQSSLFVAVIGPGWLEAKAANNLHYAIKLPGDAVRLEIEQALQHAIQRPGFVVPILVDGTPMPRKQDLPATIQELADCQGKLLDHTRFRAVMAELRMLAASRAAIESRNDAEPARSRADSIGEALPQAAE